MYYGADQIRSISFLNTIYQNHWQNAVLSRCNTETVHVVWEQNDMQQFALTDRHPLAMEIDQLSSLPGTAEQIQCIRLSQRATVYLITNSRGDPSLRTSPLLRAP